MSGAVNTVYKNVTFALQLHTKAMAMLQEQGSTGSRINRPSDDPAAAYRVMGLDSHKRYVENYIKATDRVYYAQTQASSVLQNMSDSLLGMYAELQQVVSGTYADGQGGQYARERMAQRVNDVLEQMVASANTPYLDQYLFGGDNSLNVPYAVEKVDGEIIAVTYQGGEESRNVAVAHNIESSSTMSGDAIFCSNERKPPEFSGTTGVTTGSGTSNIKNEIWLTVTHDGSNYRLSIDDGLTETIVPTSGDLSNIAVTNSNGEVLYVNASDITETGLEKVRFPGTEDVFTTLINLRDLLRNERGISNEMLPDLVEEATNTLDEVKNRLVDKQASIGMRLNFLDKLKNSLEDTQYNEEEEIAMLEEADIAQIAIDLSRRETLYQMSLSVAGKLMSNTLLDFIR